MDSKSSTGDSGMQANTTTRSEQTWTSEATPETTSAEQSTAVVESAATLTQATSSPGDIGEPTPVSESRVLQGSDHRKGLIDETTEFINDHIRIFRLLPWVIGGVGVGLLVRFYPCMAFRRYQRPSDVPQQLIEDNVGLTGIVAMTKWNSLGVWHVPMWRRFLKIQHQPIDSYSEEELLSVRFAGVAIGKPEATEQWLEDTLLGERVWFTLLYPAPDRKALSCVVYAQHKEILKFGRKWCVNEQLLAKGLGSLDEVKGFKNDDDYTNFIHRLGQRETTAKRTGAGMWEGSEYVSWWRRLAKALRLMS